MSEQYLITEEYLKELLESKVSNSSCRTEDQIQQLINAYKIEALNNNKLTKIERGN